MNIARLLFGGFLATALIAGCGSDNSGGSGNTEETPAKGGAALAGCVTTSTTDSTCQACFKSKCVPEVEECYGKGYTGGACKALIDCSKDDDDPCNAACLPDSACTGCIMDTLMPCLRKECETECDRAIIRGTCADLAACCDIVATQSAKTGCVAVAMDGNEEICHSYYGSVRAFCEMSN